MKIKKLVSIIAVCLFAVFSLAACGSDEGLWQRDKVKIYEDEDFFYSVWFQGEPVEDPLEDILKKDDLSEYNITLDGLTETGKTKEIIVVPEYINGIEVTRFTYMFFDTTYGKIGSDVLGAIYFPKPMAVYGDETFRYASSLDKIIAISTDAFSVYEARNYSNNYAIYVPSSLYQGTLGRRKYLPYAGHAQYQHNYVDVEYYCANVSYRYNYIDAENNGYYWIDNFDYGAKIEYIPKEPTRNRYTFGGWYREPECINRWDFDTDTLPERIEVNGHSKYQETSLYAKWIEK